MRATKSSIACGCSPIATRNASRRPISRRPASRFSCVRICRERRSPLWARASKGRMRDMELRDRKVLLTGAAGGLGTAITLAFAKAGARVLALDIDAAKGEALLAESARAGAPAGAVRFVRCDLADLAATGELVKTLDAEEGGVDTLINNAAIY